MVFEEAGSLWLENVFGNPIIGGVVITLFISIAMLRAGFSFDAMLAVALPMFGIVLVGFMPFDTKILILIVAGVIMGIAATFIIRR